nr:MAG TPA: hypothetical protein [Caudoviricetes sp.]
MIECRIGENTKDRYIKIAGTLSDLEMDLVTLINSIYNSIRNRSPEAAEFFAATFPRALEGLKDEIFGPAILEGVAIGTVIKKRKEEAADD